MIRNFQNFIQREQAFAFPDDGGKKLVHDHPLYYLLHDEPNPGITSFCAPGNADSHLLIWGNAYAQIIRERAGRVLGLYAVLPDKMEGRGSSKGNIYYVYSRNSDRIPYVQGIWKYQTESRGCAPYPG